VELGIQYKRTLYGLDLHGFSDADWAGDLETRRSTCGIVVYAAMGPISWMSKLIKSVCTSSMESEYTAEYMALQEIVWIRAILKEMRLEEIVRTPLFMDATTAIALSNNPVHHSRAKHIDIKLHWNRAATEPTTGFARLVKIATELMKADPLTKQLGVATTVNMRAHLLGMNKKDSKTEEKETELFAQAKNKEVKKQRAAKDSA
jgi:hypothetical protein